MAIPNFFIVGAAKAGTSSFYYYLKEHPDIYMSPIKEPFYFSTDIDPNSFKEIFKKGIFTNFDAYFNKPRLEEKHIAFIKKWEDYIKLFREARNEKAIGEMSNGYLYSKVAAEKIKEKIPYAKIGMILRDPIDRAFSHFLMDLRDGRQANKNFIKAVLEDFNQKEKGWGISFLYIELGLYYEQVKRYLRAFPRKNIKIILFDDLRRDPLRVISDFFNFLEVDSSFNIDITRKYNVASVPRFQNMNVFFTRYGVKRFISYLLPNTIKQRVRSLWFGNRSLIELKAEDREFLLPYFESNIKKLAELISRDLSDWLSI